MVLKAYRSCLASVPCIRGDDPEFELYFKQRITPEKIVYYNEKQGQKLERLVGIQFPDCYSSIAPNTIIKLPCCIKFWSSVDLTGNQTSTMALVLTCLPKP